MPHDGEAETVEISPERVDVLHRSGGRRRLRAKELYHYLYSTTLGIIWIQSLYPLSTIPLHEAITRTIYRISSQQSVRHTTAVIAHMHVWMVMIQLRCAGAVILAAYPSVTLHRLKRNGGSPRFIL